MEKVKLLAKMQQQSPQQQQQQQINHLIFLLALCSKFNMNKNSLLHRTFISIKSFPNFSFVCSHQNLEGVKWQRKQK